MALVHEELFWKQKSQTLWLEEGDKNTNFFNATTKQRRVRNRITGIVNKAINWTENESEVENSATQYFQDIFSSSEVSDLETSLANVPRLVSPEMNELLTKELSPSKVKAAVFAIHPGKATCPDGMTTFFYQKLWHIVGPQVVDMIQGFMSSSDMDPKINEVNICLISKTEIPRTMKEFRPISLCNVSYKIISKVLCHRLKRILPSLVSKTQSTFVAGCVISNNILLAQEAFHALSTKDKCKSEFVSIKTDMSKAYNKVEWDFWYLLCIR